MTRVYMVATFMLLCIVLFKNKYINASESRVGKFKKQYRYLYLQSDIYFAVSILVRFAGFYILLL